MGDEPGGSQIWEVKDGGDGGGAAMAPWVSSCSTPGGRCRREFLLDGPAWSHFRRAPNWRGGEQPIEGLPRRRTGKPVQRAHEIPQGRGGAQHSGGGVKDPPQTHHSMDFFTMEGGEFPSMEEGLELQDFTPTRAHLILREFY